MGDSQEPLPPLDYERPRTFRPLTEMEMVRYRRTKRRWRRFMLGVGLACILAPIGYGVASRDRDGIAVWIVVGSMLIGAAVPLPGLGTLRLDPANAIFDGVYVVPPSTGRVSLTYPVPNDPALRGGEIHSQGLVFESPVDLFLTGAARDVIQ